jgi:hypothetical protein
VNFDRAFLLPFSLLSAPHSIAHPIPIPANPDAHRPVIVHDHTEVDSAVGSAASATEVEVATVEVGASEAGGRPKMICAFSMRSSRFPPTVKFLPVLGLGCV